jgi:hypothetical protein
MDQQTIDTVEIEWLCTHCFNKSKKTLGWLSENDQVTCVCGSTYKLNKQLIGETIARLGDVPPGALVEPLR